MDRYYGKSGGPSVLVLNAVFAGDWSLEDESSKWQDLVTKIDSDEIHCVDEAQNVKLSHLALAPLKIQFMKLWDFCITQINE